MAPELPEEKSAAPSRTGRKSPSQDRGISREERAVPVEAAGREAGREVGWYHERHLSSPSGGRFFIGAGQ